MGELTRRQIRPVANKMSGVWCQNYQQFSVSDSLPHAYIVHKSIHFIIITNLYDKNMAFTDSISILSFSLCGGKVCLHF